MLGAGVGKLDAGALAVGAQAAGGRWFRERGGMPSFMLAPLTGRYLSFPEREEIAVLNAQGAGVSEIARRLGRDPSTISRAFAPQRGDPRRETGRSGVGCAVEGGAACAAPQDCGSPWASECQSRTSEVAFIFAHQRASRTGPG